MQLIPQTLYATASAVRFAIYALDVVRDSDGARAHSQAGQGKIWARRARPPMLGAIIQRAREWRALPDSSRCTAQTVPNFPTQTLQRMQIGNFAGFRALLNEREL
ncbi:unnamed protein product [Peniophora sp. CBMAI 1063]|nr:unnamed protein product [Peniophora sp. CBMAI 1063]